MKGINEVFVETEQTVTEWLSQWTFINFTPRQFLDLKVVSVKAVTIGTISFPAKTVTNFDRISQQYTNEEYQDALSQSALGGTVIIKAGTVVGMPNSAIKRQLTKSNILPDIVDQSNLKAFMANALRDLYSDPNYIKVVRDTNGQQQVKVQINDISVYVWIRSITNPGDNSQEGAWYDISACVESVNTFVGPDGGSFNIQFTPASTVYDKQVGWSLANVSGYESGSVREDVIGVSTISKYIYREDNFLVRNDFFFSRVLQENDLVYIRFEGLEAEKEKNKIFQRAFGGQDISGKIYDLIGLIDTVSERGSQDNVLITAGGRDLMKLLIEDGSTFFPEQAGQQIFTDPNSILTRRNLIESLVHSQAVITSTTSFKFVPVVLKYIFNKFSNIGMVPSHVFNGYGSRIEKKKYQIQSGNVAFDSLQKELIGEREGVWRIVELLFDKSVSQRVLADNSVSMDSGSIINSIRKICQEPFVEFFGDTYGDKYFFVARKLPFDEIGYKGMVYNDIESEDENVSANVIGGVTKVEKFNNLVKVKDGLNSVKNKLNRFVKSANQFSQKLQSSIKKRNILNGRPALISDLVIDIDESDVRSDSLSYSNDAYSWYHLIPKGIGIENNFAAFKFLPAIPFDEYAEIWGNKSFELEYNYTPIEFVDDSVLQKSMKYMERQTLLDLKYVIQSNAYLPFTRQGSIVINGDRRIKRGTMIYYKPTEEIFYVDAVENNRNARDRWTTLIVSRGMRERYIKGVMVPFGIKPEKVSYFDIVRTPLPDNASVNETEFLKGWRVNKNVFNFFLQRRQWV